MKFLAAKLEAPTRMPHPIPRPWILRRLVSRRVNLVLLIAPAGYGKTVLALQLL
jgi:ATP/maltotriose-dependent transcriptional regulator MalT